MLPLRLMIILPGAHASARCQWADHASYYDQFSDAAITFDNVHATTTALADTRRFRVSRLQFKIGLRILLTQRLS